MDMPTYPDPKEGQFDSVYRHHSAVIAYCRRRGSLDPEGIAAETMAIAWRRLDDLDTKECRPWLIATARNLMFEERRARVRIRPVDPKDLGDEGHDEPGFDIQSLDPEIDRALASLAPIDREALLLVAWEDLNPARAAESLGIRPTTFRVRLHRARRRFKKSLEQSTAGGIAPLKPSLKEKT